MNGAKLSESLKSDGPSALGAIELAISARYLAIEIDWLVRDRADAFGQEGRALAGLLERWARLAEAERKARRS